MPWVSGKAPLLTFKFLLGKVIASLEMCMELVEGGLTAEGLKHFVLFPRRFDLYRHYGNKSFL